MKDLKGKGSHNISEVSDKVSGKILIITSKDVLERLINSDNSSLKSVNGYMKSGCFILFLQLVFMIMWNES